MGRPKGSKNKPKTEAAKPGPILPPIKTKVVTIRIEGVSPLIQHKWSEKALEQIREKKAGKKTKRREACDKEAEALSATHFTESGGYGFPACAIKLAMVEAAHKDIGIDKKMVRKSVFIICDDKGGIVPMECSKPETREDFVRIGSGVTDLRYRPIFRQWSASVVIEYDSQYMFKEDIIRLLDLAGYGVGIGEWRPERNGEYGRFRVKR